MSPNDPGALPSDLPVPADDGGAAHLVGMRLPDIALPSTAGRDVNLTHEPARIIVIYCYSRTGRPGEPSPGGDDAWDAIPGARGCTPQSCSYRDHYAELQALGAAVYGLSTQPTEYQQEMAERLHLPFEILSDAAGDFRRALRLPTFEAGSETLLKRLTMVAVVGGEIAAVFYPVFPPDADAERVIAWIKERRA
jgi:peroxiredoxin